MPDYTSHLLLQKAPRKSGFTNMPAGYKRWICIYCGEENIGLEPGYVDCQQCNARHFITDFDEQRWAIHTENN